MSLRMCLDLQKEILILHGRIAIFLSVLRDKGILSQQELEMLAGDPMVELKRAEESVKREPLKGTGGPHRIG